MIICAGIIVADVVLRPFEGLPQAGTSRLVEYIELYSGGCAGNTAITLAKLGLRVELVASIGEDDLAEFLLRNLAREGVGATYVTRNHYLGTAATVVLVAPDGERSFLHSIGANAGLRGEHIPNELLKQAKALHIGGALLLPGFDGAPMAETLQRARALGVRTSLDTTFDRFGHGLRLLTPCFPLLDVFMANQREAGAITGQATTEDQAAFVLDRGTTVAAIKMGEQGCFVAWAGEKHRLPAFQVPVVDTTGTGDAFAAGFLAGLVAGRGWRDCALLGCAAGARCAGYPGAAAFPISLQDLFALAGH